MRASHYLHRLFLALALLHGFFPALAFAQASGTQPAIMTQNESVELVVGDILEMLPVHSFKDATYKWVLAQERDFIQAERAPIFRTRLIQPGRYLLKAEVESGESSRHIILSLTINVRTRDRAQDGAPPPPPAGDALVSSDPAMDTNGRIIVPAGRSLVKLLPTNQDQVPLSLDLDAKTDNDGDGQPGNDVDNEGTFFQSKGTPLTLWFATSLTERELAVTSVAPGQGAIIQSVSVASFDYAKTQGLLVSKISINAQPAGGMSYLFSADFETETPASNLLYYWDFGDGQTSLQTNPPPHTYASAGTYEVSVRVRDIVTGKEIAAQTESIEVRAVQGQGSSVSAPEQDPKEDEGGWLGSVLLYGTLFLVALGIGFGIVIVLRKARGSRPLSERFADMEQTLSKDESPRAPPPLVIPTTAIDKPKEVKPQAQTLPPPPAPAVNVDAAPSWLKKGLEKELPSEQTASLVTPASKPEWTPPATTPAPKPMPTPSAAPKPAPSAPAATSAPVQPIAPSAAPRPTATPAVAPQAAAPKPPQAQPAAPKIEPSEAPQPSVTLQMPAPTPPPQAPKPASPVPSTPPTTQQVAKEPIQPPMPAQSKSPAPLSPAATAQTPPLSAQPKPSQSPVQAKPVEAKTLPQPMPQTPAKPVQISPIVTPPAAKPAEPAKPVSPAPQAPKSTPTLPPTPSPSSQSSLPSDEPIAFIRADSLEKMDQKSTEPPQAK